eukprot:TRINITY_DN54764_c0_g1_i1.p2 TRINITY_DN54764_c0_g1~~TRINITY_DN54764_c0_g1_i1.p2  ORF type:complete len:126 (-),score=24.87 TRINITY_DN54764_c0_g1_i1:22-399(-)
MSLPHTLKLATTFSARTTRLMKFRFVPALYGEGGSVMKAIAQACRGKLRVRGKGSRHLEGSRKKEAPIPLQLSLSCKCHEDLKIGHAMVLDVINELEARFEVFCSQHDLELPATFFTLRLHNDGM